jgi:hypothetical protein
MVEEPPRALEEGRVREAFQVILCRAGIEPLFSSQRSN